MQGVLCFIVGQGRGQGLSDFSVMAAVWLAINDEVSSDPLTSDDLLKRENTHFLINATKMVLFKTLPSK